MTNIKKNTFFLGVICCAFALVTQSAYSAGLTTGELRCLSVGADCQIGNDLITGTVNMIPKITWSNGKAVYGSGQSAKINYQITGVGFQKVVVESGVSGNLPTAGPATTNIVLTNSQKYNGEIDAGMITEILEPGDMTYYVKVKNEVGQVLAEENYKAKIDTLPSLPVTISYGNSKIYDLGKAITVRVTTKIPKIKINIEVKQGKTVVSRSTSASFSFVPRTKGVYDIFVNVSKDKYKSVKSQTKVVFKGNKLIAQPIANAWLAQKTLKTTPAKTTTKPTSSIKTTVKGLNSEELEKLR